MVERTADSSGKKDKIEDHAEFEVPEPKRLKKNEEDSSDESDSDDGEFETINVDFEFQSPAEIDFHGFKSLLRQAFGPDVQELNASLLADYIISQPAWGTTVKADGQLDPYALFCLLPLDSEKAELKSLGEYFVSKVKDTEKKSELAKLVSSKQVSFLLNERLVNMPPQIAPPLLKFFIEELEAAEKEDGYKCTFFLFMAKMFNEIESVEEANQDDEHESAPRPQDMYLKKKKKKQRSQPKQTTQPQDSFYFQVEDEVIARHAKWAVSFKLPESQVSDSRRVFTDAGIDPFRRLFLVDRTKVRVILKEMEELMV